MTDDTKDEQKSTEIVTPLSHRIFDSSGMLRKTTAPMPREPSSHNSNSASTEGYP